METSGMEEEAASAAGPARVVKVKRKLVASCLTCPICNKLLRDATTISECLHTFCRKCIYEKLDEEETDCCPVCNIHLGCLPVEKLRADHNLQDLRAKIFPLKKPKNGACDSAPSIILPVRRKEISLSSLVNSPRVTAQTGPTGRRKKSVGNKTAAFHGCESAVCKNEDDTTDKFVKKSSSNGNSIKQSLSGRQACSNSNSSYSNANKNTENGDKTIEDREELWEPLNCLVEAANRTKSSRSGSQNPIIKPEKKKLLDGDTNTNKTIIEHLHESKAQDEKDGNFQTARMKVKARSLKAVNEKKGTLVNSTQTLLDAQSDKKIAPLWFSLVASSDKTGDLLFPQISTNYLRIKDGNIPVSYIQKYLVKKLNLVSEDEVEITCHDEPVLPTMSLHNAVEQWLRGTLPSQRLPAVIGGSAKEFVVVLGYRRRQIAA
ncbi:E3 ubiquitin protein ligase DRIP2-like [Zingiber officinale]|uniref:E3 ubiquitin protein ligase DRIP2-like n=1 Tax=Zingiber officinale TaxID=94328 RepID=UPI001C4D51E9|nr:E3 ubiquitin protein ligase DRIP2-like [Zingiber officinale]